MLDNRSFTQVRINQLMAHELRAIKEIPLEARNGQAGGTIIARLDENSGHSGKYLDGDPARDADMVDRYHITFDEATNRINLTFKVREMNVPRSRR